MISIIKQNKMDGVDLGLNLNWMYIYTLFVHTRLNRVRKYLIYLSGNFKYIAMF